LAFSRQPGSKRGGTPAGWPTEPVYLMATSRAVSGTGSGRNSARVAEKPWLKIPITARAIVAATKTNRGDRGAQALLPHGSLRQAQNAPTSFFRPNSPRRNKIQALRSLSMWRSFSILIPA